MLRRPPAQKAGLGAFRSELDCSPRRGEESNPAPSKTKRKHEHDRKQPRRASTHQRDRQAAQIPEPTTGVENRGVEGMPDH